MFNTDNLLLWTVVPFSLGRYFVVLSVFMYTEGGSTVVCCACELFWPLQIGSALILFGYLTAGNFNMFSREEGLLNN